MLRASVLTALKSQLFVAAVGFGAALALAGLIEWLQGTRTSDEPPKPDRR